MNIEDLDLNHEYVHASPPRGVNADDYISALARALERAPNVRTLVVSNFRFSERGAYALAALVRNFPIQTLDVTSSYIGDSGVSAILSATASLTRQGLRALWARWTNITDATALVFATVLQTNQTLQYVDLQESYNSITDRGAVAIARSLQSNNQTKLEGLGLAWERFTTETIRLFEEALISNDKLGRLRFIWDEAQYQAYLDRLPPTLQRLIALAEINRSGDGLPQKRYITREEVFNIGGWREILAALRAIPAPPLARPPAAADVVNADQQVGPPAAADVANADQQARPPAAADVANADQQARPPAAADVANADQQARPPAAADVSNADQQARPPAAADVPDAEQRLPFELRRTQVIPWTDISPFLVEDNILGMGATGEVYEGMLNGEEVAIKASYGRGLAEAHFSDFRREARALDNLPPHRNIMPLKYVVAERAGVALVFPRAEKLEDVCFALRRNGIEGNEEMDVPEEILKYMQDIACGLKHLHRHDLEHFDLKPANTLALQDAQNGEKHAVISDFGTARMRTLLTLLSRDTNRIAGGTVAYMAPEQAAMPRMRQFGISSKSDIWAFGLTMNELLSGEPPYEALRADALEYFVRNEVATGQQCPRACERLPRRIQEMINSCFAFNPADRPSADDLVRTLSDMVDGTLEDIMGE